jgi:hypothetical protein
VVGRLAIALVSVAALLAIAWFAVLPAVARHFSFIVRAGDPPPVRIHYDGRDYETFKRNRCSRHVSGMGPRVGEVAVLFGENRPIYRYKDETPTFTGLVVEREPGCLVRYDLLGGP